MSSERVNPFTQLQECHLTNQIEDTLYLYEANIRG